MRALIADDDRGMRTMLRRMLEQLSVDSHEVENGLELLSALEDGGDDPDFVLIDVDMPLMNGTEALRAIRSSAKYRDLPVICVSGVSDQTAIRELVLLGVSDFLLKPVRPEHAIPRLRNAIKNANRWRERIPAAAVTDLLLVDPDPNFLAFAKPILAAKFNVREAASATKAAVAFRDRSPAPGIVLVAEGLPLMSESQLVETLRRMAAQLEINSPEVYLMTFAESIDPEKGKHFHGILRKTFVPDQFSATFQRVVLKSMSPVEKLQSLLEGDLQPELLSATQQTIGVLVGEEVFRLSPDETAGLALPHGAQLTLGGPESGVALELSLASDAESVVNIAGKMLGAETSIADGAAEVLGELTNTIAGRVRASLLARDVDLPMGLPRTGLDDDAGSESSWSHRAGFRSSSGARLLVGVRVVGAVVAPRS